MENGLLQIWLILSFSLSADTERNPGKQVVANRLEKKRNFRFGGNNCWNPLRWTLLGPTGCLPRFLKDFIYYLSLCVWVVCMYVCVPCAHSAQRCLKKNAGFLGTRVTDFVRCLVGAGKEGGGRRGGKEKRKDPVRAACCVYCQISNSV